VFHAAATCSVDAAPSTEELLSKPPIEIIGLYNSDPGHNFTNWRLAAMSGVGASASISYRADVTDPFSGVGFDFLFTEGYFSLHSSGEARPTAKFILSTKPYDIAGGSWVFEYFAYEARPIPASVDVFVAYWTWTESEPVMPVASSLTLNRAIARTVRGKNPRKALPLLARQQKLLKSAATQ
jgi:hypothetical protein